MKNSIRNLKQEENQQNEDDSVYKTGNIFQINPLLQIFDNQLQAEIFSCRCQDIGETFNLEKAKIFKAEFLQQNNCQNQEVLSLQNLRIGVNTILCLSEQLKNSNLIKSLNLADNKISDFGMHSINSLLKNTQIENLNLSSNMISEIGLEVIIDTLNKNKFLKSLDLGVIQTSIRKNSLGVSGVKCIVSILLNNNTLEKLRLQDNDIGSQGGELIGAALKGNTGLKQLEIVQNNLKNQGAIQIIYNALKLNCLNLGKNGLNHQLGEALQTLIQYSEKLQILNLEGNNLGVEGIEHIALGLTEYSCLKVLNINNNHILDDGLILLSKVLINNKNLQSLDVSDNQITFIGIQTLGQILNTTQIKNLNIGKNIIGDEGIIKLSDELFLYEGCALQKLNISSSRISNSGIIYFLDISQSTETFTELKASNNFIDENVEKLLIETLDKNQNIIELNLKENRLSNACFQKVKQILTRNQIRLIKKKPNQIKDEIYRLKYEQQQIIQNQENIQKNKDLIKLEYVRMENEFQAYQKQASEKQKGFLEKIAEQQKILNTKEEEINKQQYEFDKQKNSLLMEIEEDKRKAKEAEIQYLNEKEKYDIFDADIQAKQKEMQDQLDSLNLKSSDLKKNTADIKIQMKQLNEEIEELTEQEKQKQKEAELCNSEIQKIKEETLKQEVLEKSLEHLPKAKPKKGKKKK